MADPADCKDGQWPCDLYSSLPLSNERFSIRLLRLQPGVRGAPIRCEMFCTCLVASPPYEALSYTWGLSPKRKLVSVNGVDVPVTLNLEFALRCLRYEDRDRLLWVDALCINQRRVSERNAHVAEMGEIYSFAHRVAVWLPEAEQDELDHNGYSKCQEHYEMAITHIRSQLNRAKAETNASAENMLSDAEVQIALLTIDNILQSRWFRRVWIVQEIARPRQQPLMYVFDSLTLNWSELVAFMELRLGEHDNQISRGDCGEYRDRSSIGAYSIGTLNAVRNLIQVPPRLRNLHDRAGTEYQDLNISHMVDLRELLLLTGPFEASDPRDNIFGLLPLTRGTESLKLLPDYSKSVTEVYHTVTKAMIESEGNLTLLTRCGSRFRREGLPSWVPDYSITRPSLSQKFRDPRIPDVRRSPHITLMDPDGVRFELNDTVLRVVTCNLGVVCSIYEDPTVPRRGLLEAVLILTKPDGEFESFLKAERVQNLIAYQELAKRNDNTMVLFQTSEGFVGIGHEDEVEIGGTEVALLEDLSTPILLRLVDTSGMARGARTFEIQGNVLIAGVIREHPQQGLNTTLEHLVPEAVRIV